MGEQFRYFGTNLTIQNASREKNQEQFAIRECLV
jgi:hypothetical protein